MRIANATTIVYKPFISLFNLTEPIVTDPDVRGIENYNSLAALELRAAGISATLRLEFKNGPDQARIQDSEDVWADGRGAVRVAVAVRGITVTFSSKTASDLFPKRAPPYDFWIRDYQDARLSPEDYGRNRIRNAGDP
ncbi:hypothetical protein GGX14DRAFT_658454 [Mycena pura]|uniref:Uncharacterized protein n=1 Tax=Mycena pura TaxID=153505 RepID=A0AAD7E1H6_9AGAR|nr:hypothetical protein GGX14DRAFT_658454 [Mycena pura]